MRSFIVMTLAAILLASTPLLAGCTAKIGIPGISTGNGGGPPAHAPAHGRRAKMYRYYPDANIYFDTGRGVYFYLSGGAWKMSVNLPTTLRVSLGSFVSLELDTDKPYIYNSSHKKKYPPGQAKKLGIPGSKGKGKKKWK